ncbi:MAG: hypothetical protein IJX34_00605 [Clostridia bacterium]|nr:hypothetical protein [Clostridia bacterium]
MLNKSKSGKSLILLVIVICVMSFAIVFVSRLFTSNGIDKAEEEAFKFNVYQYNLQIKTYKTQMAQNEEYNEEEFNVCGVALKNVIPDIIETDMSKFKIEKGQLVYIGVDQKEKQWTQEVRI